MEGDVARGAVVDGAPSRFRRAVPIICAVVAVIAVLAPMFRSAPPDSFPLSTLPMFATDRGDESRIDTVVAFDDDGAVVRLSPETISGSDEPVLAAATVTRAVVGGSVDSLCERVAERIAQAGRSELSVVEVVSERHDLDHFLPDEPLERTRHARCGVRP